MSDPESISPNQIFQTSPKNDFFHHLELNFKCLIFIKFGESSRQAVTLRKREEGTKKIGCMATFPNVLQQYKSWLNHLSDIPNNMDL